MKENNNMEKQTIKIPRKITPPRIKAVDNYRGYMIIYMIFGHTFAYWLLSEYKWVSGFEAIIMGFLSANAFVFIAGISIGLAYSRHQIKIKKDPEFTSKHARINYFVKTLLLLVIALITNLIGTIAEAKSFQLWVWYVLFTISIARIVCYPIFHLSPGIRIILGFSIFLLADPLRTFLFESSPELYYIFYNPPEQNTPFPFFGFIILGSVLGEWINLRRLSNESSIKSQNRLVKFITPRNLSIAGFILIIFGVLSGLTIYTGEVAQLQLYWINKSELFSLNGIPLFLVRGSGPWSFYSIGVEVVALSFFLFLDDRRSKIIEIPNQRKNIPRKITEKFENVLNLFGKYSLTIYLTHYAIVILFRNALNIGYYILAFSATVAFIYIILDYTVRKFNSHFTMEWLINFTANYAVKKLC